MSESDFEPNRGAEEPIEVGVMSMFDLNPDLRVEECLQSGSNLRRLFLSFNEGAFLREVPDTPVIAADSTTQTTSMKKKRPRTTKVV